MTQIPHQVIDYTHSTNGCKLSRNKFSLVAVISLFTYMIRIQKAEKKGKRRKKLTLLCTYLHFLETL